MELPTASRDARNTKSRRRRAREEKKASNGVFNDNDNLEDEKDHRSKNDKMYGSAYSSLAMFFLNPFLCICPAGRFSWRHRYFLRGKPLSLPCWSVKTGKRSKRDSILIILSLLVCIYVLPNLFSVMRGFRFHQHRPTSDAEVDRLDLVIPILDFKGAKGDMGGWLFPQRRIPPQAPIEHGSSEEDFGDLKYVSTGGSERKIKSDDVLLYEEYKFHKLTKTFRVDHENEHADEIEDEKHSCRRPNWLLLYKPSCNAIHALDISRNFHEEMARVGDDQIFDSLYIA
jgi:hypothetical protein